MMNFITKANLPEGKVKYIICGTDDSNILNFFKKEGITAIKNRPNKGIDPSVSSHADMCAVHLGKDKILIDKSQSELKSELESSGMTVLETQSEISGEYPSDIKLNFTLSGSFVMGKLSAADPTLLSESKKLSKIDVKQGYCKCSTLVVREDAVITDDESIYGKCLENDIDSLLIRKGDISLAGHEYGFIGGASGKISKDTVMFFGDIENHRDFEKIKTFLLKHGCNFICSDKNKIRDIGGIIPITEEV